MTYQERIRLLEQQVEHLNREKRAMLDAIDLAANLSNFRTSLNKIEDPLLIIRETADRIGEILEFKILSFYLVNEEDSDFYQAYTQPEKEAPRVEKEIDALIDDKTFAWALGRNKPVIVSTIDKKDRVVLHSMTTSSRVRGIFAGILGSARNDLTDLSLFLFSITMVACSNALESFELYRQIRDRNEKLKENLLELEEKEEKYRALFEQAASAIILYDPQTRKAVEFNDKAHQNLGYTLEEFKELRIEDYEVEETVEEIQSRLESIYGTGRISYETRYRRKDGTVSNVIVNSRPVHIRGKMYLLSLLTDITLQKEQEAERLRLEKRLRQAHKMESIGTLAGGIAHDFNNILAIILGYAELSLLDVPSDRKEIRTNITQLVKAVERAKKLVMQILTFSRQGEEMQVPFEVNAVIDESMALLRSTLPTTIVIRQHMEEELLYIQGNPTQIHQILMNLCTNAAHAMKQKPGEMNVELRKIHLSVQDNEDEAYKNIKSGHYVQITVSDTGHGMEPEVLERVFDPYFTTKKQGEGTGLGLSVVHGIIENYNGYITIDTTPGKGTVVNVRIPVVDPPASKDTEG
ncbi:MAG: PAS domain S-box protein [bacterium]|nr:PAS domain S-box protein [bacterium]